MKRYHRASGFTPGSARNAPTIIVIERHRTSLLEQEIDRLEKYLEAARMERQLMEEHIDTLEEEIKILRCDGEAWGANEGDEDEEDQNYGVGDSKGYWVSARTDSEASTQGDHDRKSGWLDDLDISNG
ncbi:hypothetical protein ACLMJK_009499 [Lecanora helva]